MLHNSTNPESQTAGDIKIVVISFMIEKNKLQA